MNPLAGVLGDAWQMYRRFAGHFLAVAFIIYAAAAVVSALLALGFGGVGADLGLVVQLFAVFLLTASLVRAVQDVRDGRVDLSVGQTMRSVLNVLGAVAVAGILAAIAITIGLAIVIVPGLVLITFWALIMPVIVLERSGPFESFGRSFRLVRGHGWNVFGTLVVLYIIQFAVNLVLGIVFSPLPGAASAGLRGVVAGTLVAPFIAIAVTLVYYRLAGNGAGWEGGQ